MSVVPITRLRAPAADGAVAATVAPGAAMAPLRVYMETYGCQMNAADSDLIATLLSGQGYARTERADEADVILVNTCAVRENAEERVFARASELRAQKHRRPGAVLAITGCMAEHLKEKLGARAPYVDVVAGPDAYRRLPALVAEARGRALADAKLLAPPRRTPILDVHLDKAETYEGLDATPDGHGVSGFVTIQRGCDKFCTFCVVPLTRGRERGTPPREVLRQVRALVSAGYKEVTLLGQTVNSYRHEDARFSDLLRAVAAVEGIERVRFTSPYPIDFTADVIAAIAEEPKVCKHVHLPVQSGSDRMLASMKRGYDRASFLAIVAELRARIPNVMLSTDILVGFSGETEDDFAATLDLMREVKFDDAFLFAYSEREGTLAERRLPDDVPVAVKKRRLAEAIVLQDVHSAASRQAQVGRTVRVLLHGPSKRSDEQLIGRTDGFFAVIVPRKGLAPGQMADVRITRATTATLFGDPIR